MNDTHGAVRQAQAERAAFGETVEQPFDARVSVMGGKSRSDGMRGEEPAIPDRSGAFSAPTLEPAREALGQRFEKGARIW